MESILEIKNIKQSFPVGFWMKRVEILHGFSFSVKRGGIFGLLGANGAGKTTLIHMVAGFRRPREGSIQILGHPADSKMARTKIGYLPERPYFHDHLTGEKFLKFMGSLSGMSDQEIRDKTPGVLARVGLAHAGKTELKRYSKGMLQRIGIAQAILHEPDLLILDEPTSGLDPVGRLEVRELILDLHKNGKTIFFSSHIISDVEAICDEVALLVRGNLYGCGKPLDFFKDRKMQFEIGVSGIDGSKLHGLVQQGDKIEKLSNGFKVLLDGEETKSQVLKGLIQCGAEVLWANPVRPSLEEIFAKTKGTSQV